MEKENNNAIHQKNKSDFKGKFGIVLLGIGVLAISVAGYSYFSGSKLSFTNGTQSGTCPMMSNTNTVNPNQGGGCGMMGNNSRTTSAQNNSSIQNQNTSQDQTSPITPTDSKSEIINMDYNDSGLTPSIVSVQIGKSYTIVINANTDVYGCMSTINIPGLDENMQTIRKGKAITFHISPTTAGEYEFLCAMGRSHNAKVLVK